MNQLTLSGFDKELTDRIQHFANQEGISLNQAALRLLRVGAGLKQSKDSSTVGSSLDHLIGTWTLEEAEALNNAVKELEQIDESMWK